jgi:predicted esterase
VSYPPGTPRNASLPVLIALHGNGGNHLSAFGDHLGLDRFLAPAARIRECPVRDRFD